MTEDIDGLVQDCSNSSALAMPQGIWTGRAMRHGRIQLDFVSFNQPCCTPCVT